MQPGRQCYEDLVFCGGCKEHTFIPGPDYQIKKIGNWQWAQMSLDFSEDLQFDNSTHTATFTY
jgi:hypothetical protein